MTPNATCNTLCLVKSPCEHEWAGYTAATDIWANKTCLHRHNFLNRCYWNWNANKCANEPCISPKLGNYVVSDHGRDLQPWTWQTIETTHVIVWMRLDRLAAIHKSVTISGVESVSCSILVLYLWFSCVHIFTAFSVLFRTLFLFRQFDCFSYSHW